MIRIIVIVIFFLGKFHSKKGKEISQKLNYFINRC